MVFSLLTKPKRKLAPVQWGRKGRHVSKRMQRTVLLFIVFATLVLHQSNARISPLNRVMNQQINLTSLDLSTTDTVNSERLMNVESSTRVMLAMHSDDRFGRKDGLYGRTQARVLQYLNVSNRAYGITDYKMWTHADFAKTVEYTSHNDLLSDPNPDINGRAYKAILIKYALQELDDGDYLIYADTSPAMWSAWIDTNETLDATYDINVLKHLTKEADDILTFATIWDLRTNSEHLDYIPTNAQLQTDASTMQLGHHRHEYFTLDACMHKMGMEKYRYSLQSASGVVVLRKTSKTVDLVSKWVHWNMMPECASLQGHNVDNKTHEEFASTFGKIGHRFDQSVLSLLINSMDGLYVMPHQDGIHYIVNFLMLSRTGVIYEFISSNHGNPASNDTNALTLDPVVSKVRPVYGL